MKVLAIDTSTSVMGIALLDNEKVYAEMITNLKKNHSVRLMPAIDQVFGEIGWTPNDIDLIAVAKGPGSYTGVRIGVTTAKVFSWSLDIPLVGVSTLETMAYGHHYFSGVISPILDARRGQVYTGLYKSYQEEWSNLEHDRIILLSDWLEILKQKNEPVLFTGDDIQLHREKIQQELGSLANFSSTAFNIPRSSIIGLIAKQHFLNGTMDNSFDFAPAYLQLAEAETKWLEKNDF